MLTAAHDFVLWLGSMPIGEALIIWIGTGLLLSLTGIAVAHWLVGAPTLIENNLSGGFKFVVFTQTFASLLGFIVIEGGVNYSFAARYTDREARALVLLEASLTRLEQPGSRPAIEAIHAYAQRVVVDEWPGLAWGREDPRADELMHELVQHVLALDPAIGNDGIVLQEVREFMLRALDNRDHRVVSSFLMAKPLAWVLLLSMMAIGVVFTWFFGNVSVGFQLAMIGIIIATAMGVTYFAALVDNPFAGVIGVQPTPFIRLLS